VGDTGMMQVDQPSTTDSQSVNSMLSVGQTGGGAWWPFDVEMINDCLFMISLQAD